jgi:hypothetical protein
MFKKMKTKMFIILFNLIILSSKSSVSLNSSEINGNLEAGLILIQGDFISSVNYNQFSNQLQSKFPGKLWLAIPEFDQSSPKLDQMTNQLNLAFENLKQSGCNLNMPFFFVGHSSGGIILQEYILDANNRNSLPVKVAGIILEGSYVERKNRDKLTDPNLPNILTIGGELDGVNRITRMTEAYYFDMKNPRFTNFEIITLIVEGMNHYQFAGEGQPPFLVKQNDIQAEISDSDARDKITSLLISFMKISMNQADSTDKALIQTQLTYTSSILSPLVDALTLEGYYYFLPPCYKTSDNKSCTMGTKWSQTSQQIMGSLNYTIRNIDLFFPASQVLPDPLPHILNNCFSPFVDNCILNTTTVSEAVYNEQVENDSSLEPLAATEIKSKLSSRQSILFAATGIKYDFKVTDGGNLCGDINNEALKYAFKTAPKATLSRYNTIGRKLTIGADIDMSNFGPLWIWKSMVSNF